MARALPSSACNSARFDVVMAKAAWEVLATSQWTSPMWSRFAPTSAAAMHLHLIPLNNAPIGPLPLYVCPMNCACQLSIPLFQPLLPVFDNQRSHSSLFLHFFFAELSRVSRNVSLCRRSTYLLKIGLKLLG